MELNRPFKTLLIVVVSFLVYYLLFQNFNTIKVGFDRITNYGLTSYILTYLIIGIPIFIGTYLINRKGSIVISLGLSKNILVAIGLSILFTLPMFLGGFIFFEFDREIKLQQLFAGTIVAGFMEELYFRGFLFGQLFRNTNLGFLPSIFFGALIFAFGHLYQSQNVSVLIGIFLITFLGAVFFAWLYVEWNYNLWVPIFTHALMNLSWSLFNISDTALGGLNANIFRWLTIIFSIAFTIIFKNQRNEPLIITRKTLMVKPKNQK